MLTKKAHWTISITGEDSDKISLVELVENCKGLAVEVSSAHASIHWTDEPRKPPKE